MVRRRRGLTDIYTPKAYAATFSVAASDAAAKSKAQADYVCGGVNDEVQIEAAIAALPAVYGKIVLTEGTFYITAQLDVDLPCLICGSGPQATTLLIGTGLQWGVDIGSSNVKLQDLRIYTVDGDTGAYGTGTHCVGMTTTGLTDLAFENCFLEHARIGIKWWSNKHISVKNCKFDDLGGKAVGTMGGGEGIAEYVSVEDCEFTDGGGNAVCMDPARHFTISDIRLISTSVDQGYSNRIDLTSSNHTVEDGVITNVVAEQQGGIESPNPTGGADPPTNIAISNVTVVDAYDYPAIQGYFGQIAIDNISFVSDDWTAINILSATHLAMTNVIANCLNVDGMAANTPAVNVVDADNAQIDNLKVFGSGIASGACLYFNGADVKVTNSEFRNSKGNGVLAAGVRASLVNCLFGSNDAYGIRFNVADGRLVGCTFRGNGAGAPGTLSDVIVPAVGGPLVSKCTFYSTDVDYHFEESSATGSPSLIEGNVFAGTPSVSAVRAQKTGTTVRGNVGYIAPGEHRSVSGILTAGVANEICFAWHNLELQDILIKKGVVEVTTGGGTVGSHLDVGIADDAAGTNRGTGFFDDLLLNNAQVDDSWVAGDGGTQTKWVLCQDNASVTDGWIVGQILDANAASLVGRVYIEYVGR